MRQPVSCYDKSLDLLSRRSHLRRELAFKLSRRGYDEEEVERTLNRLEEKGFLNDFATAKEWVASRLAKGPEGRLRLLAELMRRGASREAAEAALVDLGAEEETALLHRAVERWRARRRPGGEPQNERAALARYLERRGFPRHAIVAILAGGGADAVEPFGFESTTED